MEDIPPSSMSLEGISIIDGPELREAYPAWAFHSAVSSTETLTYRLQLCTQLQSEKSQALPTDD